MAGRIPLVEDDLAVRSFAACALRAEGYEVVEASDVLEAWAIAKQSRLDLLTTDSKMPASADAAHRPDAELHQVPVHEAKRKGGIRRCTSFNS
jgi:CheY-like chemotaxis protein